MFERLGRLTTTHPWGLCAAWILAGILLSLAAPDWDSTTQDDDIHFLPDRCASVRGYRLLEQAFPRDVFASRAICAVERTNGPLICADFALVDQLTGDLEQLRREEPGLQIGMICSYRDGFIGRRLTSGDNRCTLIQVALGTPFLALQTRTTVDRMEARLQQRLVTKRSLGDAALRVLMTGPAGLGRDLTRASADGLDGTTWATVGLVIVILLLVYRAPLLALVPLATIGVSVWVALKLLALTTLLPGVHLVNISKVFAIVILYGAGTDYCLFLISRYREELGKTSVGATAIQRSLGAVGGALAASAGTVICGLGLMGCAEFAKVRCAGPAIGLSLAVALVASLTLTPALLSLLGRVVFWPACGPRPTTRLGEPRESWFWAWISRGVIARPVLVWSVAMLALAPMAVLGLRVSPNYKVTGELPPSAGSIQGMTAIQRHFTAGEISPLTVLLASPTDWDSPTGREVLTHLSQGFALLPNVAEVRGLTQPLGRPWRGPALDKDQRSGIRSQGSMSGLVQSFSCRIDGFVQRAAREFYVATVPGARQSRFVTRLDVVFRSDPFDAASADTMELIQTWLREELPRWTQPLGQVDSECYGVTVSARDLAEITEADRSRINCLVLGGIFLILLLLVRRGWLAGYLLLTVLASYYATLGATVLAGTLWSGRPLDQVEWRVPFFLFTILVAVGEDYNILLITRVLQEQRGHGVREGIRRALARTGGTITSCGLIMAGTFATLMLSGLGTLVQIGFALAFGVLLDTFVIRPILVPAFTLFVWRDRRKRTTEQHKILKFELPPRLAA
jgi:RND superfamily putative drug exporter